MRVLQGCVMALSWSELGALSAEAVAPQIIFQYLTDATFVFWSTDFVA